MTSLISQNDTSSEMDLESKYFISRSFPPLEIEFKQNDQHLLLRPYQVEDVEKFEEALCETLPLLYKYMTWASKKWDKKKYLQWLIRCHGNYFLGTEFEWACFDKISGEFLLSIGIMPATPMNPDCWELGYWTAQKHMGKGLATLASQMIIAIAFKCLQIRRLQVGCMKENNASLRVIEKCGFHYEGELRQFFPPPTKEFLDLGAIDAKFDYLYSLLPEDCDKLSWYKPMIDAIEILTVNREKIRLSQLI